MKFQHHVENRERVLRVRAMIKGYVGPDYVRELAKREGLSPNERQELFRILDEEDGVLEDE